MNTPSWGVQKTPGPASAEIRFTEAPHVKEGRLHNSLVEKAVCPETAQWPSGPPHDDAEHVYFGHRDCPSHRAEAGQKYGRDVVT
jgi:hypothetical protein